MADWRQQNFYTTLAFATGDVCTYELTSQTTFQLENKIQFNVSDASDVDIYIYTGPRNGISAI